MVGLSDPDARPENADSCRGKADPSGKTEAQGRQGREGQRWRGKLRPGRDLHDAGSARPRDRSHCFPRNQNGWPLFFAFPSSSSSQEDGVHGICQRRDRHSSFPSQLSAASDPDASQPTSWRVLQPPRSTSWIVALMSCCLVRLSNGGMGFLTRLLSHYLRAPGVTFAALASRLDPLAFSGDKRGRSNVLFLAVLNGTSISDPEPVNVSRDPENWACGQATSESAAKDVISARISFPTRAATVPHYSMGIPLRWRTIFAIPRRRA